MPGEAHPHTSTDAAELWQDWNEAAAAIHANNLKKWRGAYRDPFGLYQLWMKQAMFLKQCYDTTWGMWMWMDGGISSSMRVLETQRQFIEICMSTLEACHCLQEVMFPRLPVSRGADLAHVAKIVDSLEERIYTIEDAFVHIEDSSVKTATEQMGRDLAERLERVESKLELLDTQSSLQEQTRMPGDLAERLERVEDKLTLLLTALEKIEARYTQKDVHE